MTEQDQENFRVLGAMFAMAGLLQRTKVTDPDELTIEAVKYADSLIAALEKNPTTGLPPIKSRRKYKGETDES
jgi:hypothetical protein